MTQEEAGILGRFLGEWAASGSEAAGPSGGGRGLFVVASVDFSHYLPKAAAASFAAGEEASRPSS